MQLFGYELVAILNGGIQIVVLTALAEFYLYVAGCSRPVVSGPAFTTTGEQN